MQRLLANGKLDPTFGIDGVTLLAESASYFLQINGLHLFKDNSLLVAASVNDFSAQLIANFIYRLDPQGKLDPKFGQNGSIRIGDEIYDVFVDDQSATLVDFLNATTGEHAVTRFLLRGQKDPDYLAQIPQIHGVTQVNVALTQDNQLAFCIRNNYQTLTLFKSNQHGRVDAGFGGSGVVNVPFQYTNRPILHAEREHLVLAAYVHTAATDGLDLVFFRYHLDGSPDKNFAENGMFRA